MVGADRVMFSVDWPFEDVGEGAQWFDGAAISESDRHKIGRDNAIKLFKLPLTLAQRIRKRSTAFLSQAMPLPGRDGTIA